MRSVYHWSAILLLAFYIAHICSTIPLITLSRVNLASKLRKVVNFILTSVPIPFTWELNTRVYANARDRSIDREERKEKEKRKKFEINQPTTSPLTQTRRFCQGCGGAVRGEHRPL